MEQHLSQYKIFYEVARCGNISRAAKELYISQPAISKAISKLEESLGTRLFNRNSRGVQLTREGTILFQHVNTAFDSIGHGERELKRIHDFHIGNLKIGVSNTLCKYVLLPYLKGFIGKYPHVNIAIESQSTYQTLDMLDARKIDIGLVAEPKNRKGLHFQPLMEISDIFVCTPAYLENLHLREGNDPDIFSQYEEIEKTATKSKAYGFSPDLTGVTDQIAAVTDVVSQYIGQITTGSVDPETAIPDLQNL